jgi:pyruvate dehydrogenase E1 component beta subunit
MISAIEHEGPVIFLEHKLLADYWLDFLGAGGRSTVTYDVPDAGACGPVPDRWSPVPLGKAVVMREGSHISMVSVGVGVHRALEAADVLGKQGVSSEVIDLRTVSPLDTDTLCDSASKTGRLLVIDEDYRSFGLSGETAARVLEAGIAVKFRRVCTEETIPYNRELEDQVLPNTKRIIDAAWRLLR